MIITIKSPAILRWFGWGRTDRLPESVSASLKLWWQWRRNYIKEAGYDF